MSAENQPAAESSFAIAARRSASMASLMPWVKRVLLLAQEDTDLQFLLRDFTLTRDLSEDYRQFLVFRDSLWPKMANSADFGSINANDLTTILEIAYDELLGISVLGPFWRDTSVTEILVDGWDKVVVEVGGQLYDTPVKFNGEDHARTVARQLAQKVSDRALTPRTPLVTAELPGARVTFAIDRVVKSGISISMRKFPKLMDMAGLLAHNSLTTEMRDFLADCVKARANILVSGGTGTGKTTFINALSEFIPDSERVITIEDAYELSLRNSHWVALQTKEAASADDEVRITLDQLLVTTLRMRPDRVIVGEIREGKGAATMLQAANTGHDGTMTTIHANTADRALNFRLVGLARIGAEMPSEMAAAEVASAIDLVVQIVRHRGRRFVSTIAAVDTAAVSGSLIQPDVLFTGAFTAADDDVVFTRAGVVRADTDLAMKLADAGLAHRWVKP